MPLVKGVSLSRASSTALTRSGHDRIFRADVRRIAALDRACFQVGQIDQLVVLQTKQN